MNTLIKYVEKKIRNGYAEKVTHDVAEYKELFVPATLRNAPLST